MVLNKTEKKNQANSCEPMPQIFSSLGAEQLKIMEDIHFEVQFRTGETIFKQGSALTHIVYLKEGKAKMVLEDTNNQTILLKILKQGDFIGGAGLITDYRNYYSLVAIEDTMACFVDVNTFKTFIESSQPFALTLIAFLNRDVIKLYDKIKSLTNKHMNGRLADTLLYLSDEVYNSLEFTTPLSRLDIANMSSMTKESAIRTLKNFKEDGIVNCKHDTFKILKKDALLEISKKG